MANRSDYTITTLSESVQQRDFAAGVNGTQAPFLFGGPLGPPNLRGRNTAYVSAEGNPVAPRPPQPPLTVNLSKISVSTTAYSATAENYQFLVNLDKISVGTTAYSASAENAIEYISPSLYIEFETSSSTEVSGNRGTYASTTASLEALPGGTIPGGTTPLAPRYTTPAFSGSYGLEFADQSNVATDNGFMVLGTPAAKDALKIFSGSFTVNFWYRPKEIGLYKGMFSFKDYDVAGSGYQWMLVQGLNSSGRGSIGWYVYDVNNAWNFWPVPADAGNALANDTWAMVTYVVSGAYDAVGDRSIKGYINGFDLGSVTDPGGQGVNRFSKRYDTSKELFFGSWYAAAGSTAGWEMNGSIDEVSFWNFDLSADQVTALYNGGSGSYAMTALTQSA